MFDDPKIHRPERPEIAQKFMVRFAVRSAILLSTNRQELNFMTVDIDKIKASDYAHLIHPLFHSSEQKDPFVWVKGEGAVLHTADGRQLIDGLSGLWNVSLGHGRTELAQAAAT